MRRELKPDQPQTCSERLREMREADPMEPLNVVSSGRGKASVHRGPLDAVGGTGSKASVKRKRS